MVLYSDGQVGPVEEDVPDAKVEFGLQLLWEAMSDLAVRSYCECIPGMAAVAEEAVDMVAICIAGKTMRVNWRHIKSFWPLSISAPPTREDASRTRSFTTRSHSHTTEHATALQDDIHDETMKGEA